LAGDTLNRKRGGIRRNPAGGRFSFNKLGLEVWMTQFEQFRLQQRVIARIIHQAKMILELRIEADNEKVIGERNRMAFKQIAACKWTDPADGLE